MDFIVARDEWQAGDARLGSDHSIVGIFDADQRRCLEEKLRVVDTEIEIVRLREGYEQIPKRQRQADLAAFGEEHQLFEHGERHQDCIDTALDPVEDSPRAPAQPGFAAVK